MSGGAAASRKELLLIGSGFPFGAILHALFPAASLLCLCLAASLICLALSKKRKIHGSYVSCLCLSFARSQLIQMRLPPLVDMSKSLKDEKMMRL